MVVHDSLQIIFRQSLENLVHVSDLGAASCTTSMPQIQTHVDVIGISFGDIARNLPLRKLAGRRVEL